jgi:hypothetical protein
MNLVRDFHVKQGESGGWIVVQSKLPPSWHQLTSRGHLIMLTLSNKWNPIDPQSNCLAKDVFRDETLVARIVDATSEIYISASNSIRIYQADILCGQVWETGDTHFSDERSALRSIEARLVLISKQKQQSLRAGS